MIISYFNDTFCLIKQEGSLYQPEKGNASKNIRKHCINLPFSHSNNGLENKKNSILSKSLAQTALSFFPTA